MATGEGGASAPPFFVHGRGRTGKSRLFATKLSLFGGDGSRVYIQGMTTSKERADRERAVRDFRRMVLWIAMAAVLMVIAALAFLASQGSLTIHMVVATIAGTFISVLLGCGLFALAFFSDKSGHDDDVTNATRRDDTGP